MRVLVTGATGFVGFAVAAALKHAGHDVSALTRSGRALPEGIRPLFGDLLDGRSVEAAIALERPEAVCHLAALARVRESRSEPLRYWDTNVGGTLSLLGALATLGRPCRLVASSTCAVYGDDATQPINEEHAPRPTSPYGTTKLAADFAIADLAATGVLGAVSLRAFNIAGAVAGRSDPDTSRLVPKIISVATGVAEELVVNGDGSVVRDYVHVADMAEAFVRAIDACEVGRWRAFNVGSGRRSTIAEVVAAAEEVLRRPLPVRHAPPANEPRVLIADASRISAELGWRPDHSDLGRIVRDAYEAVTRKQSASE